MQTVDVTQDCQAIHAQLPDLWLEEPDEVTSSVLLDHISTCRSCLKRWIALQAAADLALFPPLGQQKRVANASTNPRSL